MGRSHPEAGTLHRPQKKSQIHPTRPAPPTSLASVFTRENHRVPPTRRQHGTVRVSKRPRLPTSTSVACCWHERGDRTLVASPSDPAPGEPKPKRPRSEAQRAASRANGVRSSGPKRPPARPAPASTPSNTASAPAMSSSPANPINGDGSVNQFDAEDASVRTVVRQWVPHGI